MLSKSLVWKNHVYSICEKSAEISLGAVFSGVRFAQENEAISFDENVTIECCAKISENEILFRSKDGQYYFSLCDGWGEENGILYGLKLGFFHDFKHPTTPETIANECEASLGTYHSWSGAMAYQARKKKLEIIKSAIGE